MPNAPTKTKKVSLSAEETTSSFFDTEYLKTDLKGRSVRGGAITVFSQGCKFVLQTGSTVVLARLLTPADFGLIAMVTAITGFAMMFSSLGLSTATVQKAEINHGQVSTLFWINVALGVLVAAVVIGLAPAVAWFYDDPRLTPVTMALGAAFVFGGLAVQHQAMLQRHMRFFAIGIVEVVSMAVGVAVAIVAGVFGAGYWSLVIMHIAMAATAAVGNWIAFPWLPGLPKRGGGIREMLGFGGNITGFNIVNYFARNVDNILIGKFVGAAALGFYSKAYGLLMLPLRQINVPVSAVALPSLSRLNNDPQRYKNYYLKTISLITFITAPLIAFMVVMAEDIILLVLGKQWLEASTIFAVLGISAFIQPLYNTQGWLHISAGQSRRYFRWGLIGSIIIVVSFLLGLPYGAIGVAIAYTIAVYVIIVPCMWYAGNSAGIKVTSVFSAVWKLYISAICAGITCKHVLGLFVINNNVTKIALALLILLFSYVIYIVVLYGSLLPLNNFFSLFRYIRGGWVFRESETRRAAKHREFRLKT